MISHGQEGLIRHLLARSEQSFSLGVYATLLAVYFLLSVSVFGIFVPAGNFIPAMTLGAGTGRIVGQLFAYTGMIAASDVGTHALIGAAAVLGGVTRMTLTLAVILVEVISHDLP